MTPVASIEYDEFGLFHENAEEVGLPYDGPPTVERISMEVAPGQRLSALRWGTDPPELVLLHGGGQNAHTWDTVALALGRPLLAIDLPGHGHSDWRDDHRYFPAENAAAVEVMVRAARARCRSRRRACRSAGSPRSSLAAQAPDLVRRLSSWTSRPG